MGSFCCDVEEGDNERVGIREQRRCRDVLFLILFGFFWIGMFIICGMASKQGDVNRLVYGLDSYGFLCGTENKWQGQTVDLRNRQKLYYLNTLEMVDILNLPYAKTVCVESCPSGPRVCGLNNLPCKNNTQYRCPYYHFAEDQLYGTLVELEQLGKNKDFNTTYFSALKATTQTQCNRTFEVTGNVKFSSDFLTASTCGEYYQLSSQYNQGPCYPTWVGTVDYFHTCYPDASLGEVGKNVVTFTVNAVDRVSNVTGVTSKVKKTLQKVQHRFLNYLADLDRGWAIWVVSGLIGGLVVSVVWMVLVRFFGGFMTWTTVILLNGIAVLFTLFCFAKGNVIPGRAFVGRTIESAVAPGMDPSVIDRRVWILFGVLAAIATAAIMICTCCMVRQLQVAVATLKVAVKAVVHMPSLFLFPLIPFILTCALVAYWVSISLLLWSAGELRPHYRQSAAMQAYSVGQLFNQITGSNVPLPPAPPPPPMNRTYGDCATDPNCFYEYKWNSELRYAFVWHVFGLLWTYQFLYGFTYVTIAGAVAYFYWNRADGSMPALPVVKSMWNALAYHLGSVALGAFILAVLELIRLILVAIQKSLKQQNKGCCGCGSCLIQWCCCCAQCCVQCLESIVDFINRNAYIMIAIKGKGYCSSARTALSLISSNSGRQLAVEVVTHFLLFFGKLAVGGACGIFAFLMTGLPQYSDKQGHPRSFITTPAIIVMISVLLGYFIADLFFAVYEVAVQTIFLSFCEDIAAHGGVPRFAPPALLEAIGEYRSRAYGVDEDLAGLKASQFMTSSPDPKRQPDSYQFSTADSYNLAGLHSPLPDLPPHAGGGYNNYSLAPPQPGFTSPMSAPQAAYNVNRPQPSAYPPGPPPLNPYPRPVERVTAHDVLPSAPPAYAGPPPPGYPSIRRETTAPPPGYGGLRRDVSPPSAGYGGMRREATAPPDGYGSLRESSPPSGYASNPAPPAYNTANRYPSLTPYMSMPPPQR